MDSDVETQLCIAAPPPGRIGDLETALDAVGIASVCAFDGLSFGNALTSLRDVCHARGIPLLVEAGSGKAVELAQQFGLDGVHVPAGGKAVAHARRTLGKDAIIGADAGCSRHDGMNAAEAGADYVAFGPVGTAPDTVDPELIQWWAAVVETPQIAYGGITPEAAGRLSGVTDFILLNDEIWSVPSPIAALTSLGGAL